MNCKEAEKLLSESLDGPLDRSRRRALEDHLESCHRCARLAAQMGAVEQWARHLRPADPGPDFTERVMARIAATGFAAPRPGRSHLWRAAAAGFLVAAASVAAAVFSPISRVDFFSYLGESFGAFAETARLVGADLVSLVQDLVGEVSSIQGAFERTPLGLHSGWLVVAVVAGVVVMVFFNYAEARAAGQGYGRRPMWDQVLGRKK